MGKRKKAVAAVFSVMVLLTVVSRAAASFTVARVRVEQPQARKIIHTVTGDGVVGQLQEQAVYATADVRVANVRVRAGQTVKKGQILARLDTESLKEKMQALSDEVSQLELENDALASAQAKNAAEKKTARARAKEDYDATVQRTKDAIEEAKKQAKDTQTRLRKAQAEAYETKLAELKAAVKEAKKAYEDAVDVREREVRAAERAVEDAQSRPSETYDDAITQISIDQKEREIAASVRKWNALARQITTVQQQISDCSSEQQELQNQLLASTDDGEKLTLQAQINEKKTQIATLQTQKDALYEQWEEQGDTINDQKDALEAAKLSQQAKENEKSSEEEARKQTLLRAQEDYDDVVKKNDQLVSDAARKWADAKQALADFLEDTDDDVPEDSTLQEADRAVETARQQQKEQTQAAKRAWEDATATEAEDHTIEINAIQLAQKKRQIALLQKEIRNGGKVTAPLSGMVTNIGVATGEKTGDTAAFLLADLSGGLRFTTEISRADAAYVAAGDTVTLTAGEEHYEGLTVLSAETSTDGSVKLTVYVKKHTLAVGTQATMEAQQTSDEYRVTVPLTAVHVEQDKYFVYTMENIDTVLGSQYAAKKVYVSVKEKNAQYAALADADLSAEDLVITDTDAMLSAGERVRLQEEGDL